MFSECFICLQNVYEIMVLINIIDFEVFLFIDLLEYHN